MKKSLGIVINNLFVMILALCPVEDQFVFQIRLATIHSQSSSPWSISITNHRETRWADNPSG